MWTVHVEAQSRKKCANIWKTGRVLTIYVCLMKIERFFKSFFNKNQWNTTLFKIWRYIFFASITDFIVEKDSDKSIQSYRGSGVDFFFPETKMGVSPKKSRHFCFSLTKLWLYTICSLIYCCLPICIDLMKK